MPSPYFLMLTTELLIWLPSLHLTCTLLDSWQYHESQLLLSFHCYLLHPSLPISTGIITLYSGYPPASNLIIPTLCLFTEEPEWASQPKCLLQPPKKLKELAFKDFSGFTASYFDFSFLAKLAYQIGLCATVPTWLHLKGSIWFNSSSSPPFRAFLNCHLRLQLLLLN